MQSKELTKRMPRPRIGLLPTGHRIYWKQFPGLKSKCMELLKTFRQRFAAIGDVITPTLVDTPEKAVEAGRLFGSENIDILFVFPLGYTTGMVMVPALQNVTVPIRLLNAHLDSSYLYNRADTADYLYHEGPCCIPEYAGTLVNMGRSFKVRTGHFHQTRLWEEIENDCHGAAAARMFKSLEFGIIGSTYTNMTDMPTDEHRLLKLTGKLLKRPEVEEIEEAYKRVTKKQIEEMYLQFRELYNVDPSVTNEHMKFSAQLAVAYDEIIKKHDISAFGYYWWGEKEIITQLRAQSALAVSRLAAEGRPGVTEGDVKTAMAMKLLDLLGAGGMFVEFFALDFDDNHILVGHDGPSNVLMAEEKPKLQHLKVHHGKTGHGLGIDFKMRNGHATLLCLTQFGAEDSFKLIYTRGEIVAGDILRIGNPNCRIRISKPIHQFFNDWCQAGPCHHMALGVGNKTDAIEVVAETLRLKSVRI